MPRLRPLIVPLFAGAVLIWTLPAFAVYPGSCTNGQTVYTKTNVATGVTTSCSNSSCHGVGVNLKFIQRGAGNPGAINNALDGTLANAEMVALDLRNNLPLSAQDIDDLATYIFYALPNGNCAAPSPNLQAAPPSVAFGSTTVGSTSGPIAVTVTNVGTADATGVSVTNTNATEFIVSGNTCAGATVAPGNSCALNVAFKPSVSGGRSSTLTLTYNSKTLSIFTSGTGTSAAPQPGELSMTTATSFASQTVDTTSAAKAISVTNIGGQPVVVTSVSSSNPSEFAVTNSTCATVNAGAGCTISITFTPGTPGTRSATITVVSDGTGSPQTIRAGGTGVSATSAATVTVVEYRNSLFDHYFITPVAAEIALLDARAPPFQDWSRTGFSFNVYVNATAPAASVAICRFFNDTFAPKSSHFYGPRGGSCDVTLATFPDWKLEDDKLFNAMLSDMTGACPLGTIPVYRLYNQGMGGAPNHRFVTSLAEWQNMVNQGWKPEGNGSGVETCVPP